VFAGRVVNDPVSARTVFRWSVAAGLGLLAVGIGALAIYTVRGIFVLAIVALFVAVSLDPAVRWLSRHGVRRTLAVTLIFGVAFIAVAGLVAAVVPPLVRQAATLSADLPGYIDRFAEQSRPIREFGDRYGLTGHLRDLAKDLPAKIGANVLGFARTLFGAVAATLTVIVLTIYFMADLPRLRRGVVRLFPPERRHHVARTVDVTVDKVGSYMIGNLLISVVAGIATFAIITAVGAPFALPLALVVAIADLIPLIGATLGAAVCVVVTALSTDIWPTAVLVVVLLVLYQQLENYVIAPRVLRNAVDLPAVAVLLAGLIGATVLGLVGALMAIPIAAVVRVIGTPMIDRMDAVEAHHAGARPEPGAAERDTDERDTDEPGANAAETEV
jgi:predicted PurR-regulated permease PerM